MGKVFSVVTRPLKNFNVESRAHKIISKEKPVAAPHYAANILEAEKLLKGTITYDSIYIYYFTYHCRKSRINY